jgi:predicted ester cyclase
MPHHPNPQPNQARVLAQNKAIMRRLLHAFARGDTSAIDEFISPDIIEHSAHPIPRRPGEDPRVALKEEMLLPLQAFPDQHFREEAIVAQGDMVYIGWEMSATHGGDIYGRKASGRQVLLHGGDIVRIKDGKIVEHWDQFTKPRLESLIQIGVLDQQLQQRLGDAGLL